ncbi:hypothetical protein GCM10020001_008320 [Nonomuraea salmonea]
MTAPKHAPVTTLASTSAHSTGISAETAPAAAAPDSAQRITRTRPNRSDSRPHSGWVSPYAR